MSETTIRIPGAIGRRAWAVAWMRCTRMRYLGDTVGETEITFRKAAHARDVLKLQMRDMAEGLTS